MRSPSSSCRCGARAASSARSTCSSDTPGQFTETDEAMLRQFGAHVAVAIENARLFEREREYTEHARDAGRDRPRVRRRSSTSTSCSTRIAQPDATRRSTTARSASCCSNEETQELEMKLAVRYGEQVDRAARQARRGPGRLRGAAQGAGARARRVEGPALHQGRRRRAVGAGDPAAAEGPLHRRVRPREPGARRVHARATSRS